MNVKIGNKLYDPNKEPIMIILSDEDKKNILNMDQNCTKYACFPDKGFSEEDIKKFMEE